jgi:hypothetical protein
MERKFLNLKGINYEIDNEVFNFIHAISLERDYYRDRTCSTCKFWKNHNSIQDIYPDMSFTIPIEWKLCTNKASYSLTNMFLKDKKFEEFIAEKEIEYYGLDENGKFIKNVEYLHHRSELFGCKFHENEN